MCSTYKLYVGLSRAKHSEKIDRNLVVTTVAKYIDSFTVYDALGFFRGIKESTLVFTIAHESNNYIKTLAQYLCSTLDQDGVGVEYDGQYHRITQNDFVVNHLGDTSDSKEIV